MSLIGSNNEEKVYNFLIAKIPNIFGVCGLMGNLFAESGLKPTNLQNSYEQKFTMTDDQYTTSVDNGDYQNFVYDKAGYGLAQWTYYSRKQNLLNYCRQCNKSIGDLETQLEFLFNELKGYKNVFNVLNTATSVRQASNVVLLEFERPANTGVEVQNKRAEYGEMYYAKFSKEEKEEYTMSKKVCIDPGHCGKYNRCPSIPEYYESEMVWKLSYLQKKYLEQLGVEVVMTRTDANKDLGLYERGAKSSGCALFLSNHSNAVGSGMNESVDYVAVYHLTDDKTVTCDDVSKEFANKIAPVIASVMGVSQGYRVVTRKSDNDRNGDGVLNDNYYGVLNGARAVKTAGLILEHSFHTNSKTVKWLLSDSNLDKLARAEAECIASFVLGKTVTLSSSTSQTPQKEPTNTNVLYRVQTGAYSKKENAVAQYNNVKSKGFDAIIVQVNGLYKVQVGAYSVKKNADNMLASIKKAGFDAFITTAGGTQVSVSASTTTKTLTTNSRIKIKSGAKTYDGKKTFASFVYKNTYDVISISGDRVVFGIGTAVTGAIHKDNVVVQ